MTDKEQQELPIPLEPHLVIVTGMSGAGRTEAMRALEDMGFFCVDNLPPRFILNLVELLELDGRNIRNIAAACDVRSQEFFPELISVINSLKEKSIKYKIVFLDADDSVLLKRFKKDRRRHLLSSSGRIMEGIQREREMMQEVKEISDYVIDTSSLEVYQLKDKLKKIFLGPRKKRSLVITITSFGFKYGIPMDSDLIFDVRFIPNPYYVDELKDLTGLDERVRRYVLEKEETREFLARFFELLAFLIPNYEREGKTHLAISIGCTGGKHRSVVIAEELKRYLEEKDFNVSVTHRDIDKTI